ncbi:MAG: cell envelope integrity protein TolA [Betaproteobacteria bacterium]|nr:cell envelope integrity protein TolA [Betaproteobacteria bacterium]
MAAYAYETRNEKVASGALALVMHALFFALLVIGVSWQKRHADTIVAELWGDLPRPAPKVEPEPPGPPPKAAPAPPPPKAAPKPAPRVEPRPAPKADINLREKKEKALKAKAQAQALAEKKRREEQARLEAIRQQEAKDAEARRLAREQEEALRKLAQQKAAAQAREIDKYKRAIAGRIKRFIIEPPNLQGNPEVELDIIVLPGGEVLDVRTRRASGQSPWDNAVERAIRRAQPLPLPSDPALMKEFRELNLKFRPKE